MALTVGTLRKYLAVLPDNIPILLGHMADKGVVLSLRTGVDIEEVSSVVTNDGPRIVPDTDTYNALVLWSMSTLVPEPSVEEHAHAE